jgi:arabinofuranosyltransferase
VTAAAVSSAGGPPTAAETSNASDARAREGGAAPPDLRARDFVYAGLLVAAFLALAARLWFVCDDAFISFRYARRLADGQGLRFNSGPEEPVEGYSNLLWVLLAAAARTIGLDMVVWMPRLSCACGAALVAWLHFVLRRRLRAGPELAALATGSLAVFPPFAAYASSGLETMPFALAFFATFERLVLRRGGPDWMGGAVAGAALLLLRVEGFAWCAWLAALCAFAGWRSGSRWQRPLLRWSGVVAALFAAVLVHRRLHFHAWVSNTARAKVLLDPEQLLYGGSYVLAFALSYLVPFVAVPTALGLLARFRRDPAAVPIALSGLAFPVFAVLVGGDFMCMGRLLVPGLPIQALALCAALRDLAAGAAWRGLACGTFALSGAAVGLLPAASVLPFGPGRDVEQVPRAWLQALHFRLNVPVARTETEQWRMQKEHAERLRRDGRALAMHTQPGESIVLGAIGAIGYEMELFVYDCYGLVTREVAELPAKDRKLSPGHERHVRRNFFAARRPTYMDHAVVPAGNRRAVAEAVSAWKRLPGTDSYAPAQVRLPANREFRGELLLLFKHFGSADAAQEAWRSFERLHPRLGGTEEPAKRTEPRRRRGG